jgi:hypothetical protein
MLSTWKSQNFNWLGAARQLVEQIDHGNHYQMLESILGALEQRNKTAQSTGIPFWGTHPARHFSKA